ncbi:MAG: hypothetical protein ABI706_17780 [Ilumatobacteraceae bacterium]
MAAGTVVQRSATLALAELQRCEDDVFAAGASGPFGDGWTYLDPRPDGVSEDAEQLMSAPNVGSERSPNPLRRCRLSRSTGSRDDAAP